MHYIYLHDCIYENELIVSIKLNSLHRLHVCMLSVKSIEYFLEKGVNRLAVLFSGIAPAILEAQTWSHFGLEKKERQALITLAQMLVLQNAFGSSFVCSKFLKREV